MTYNQSTAIQAGAPVSANQKKRDAIARETEKLKAVQLIMAELKSNLLSTESNTSNDELEQENNFKVIDTLTKKISSATIKEANLTRKVADMNNELTKKILSDRRYVSMPKLNRENEAPSLLAKTMLNAGSFVHKNLDEDASDRVFNVLAQAESFRAMQSELALMFGCDDSEVLLYSGGETWCTLWFAYNEGCIEAIKNTGSAKFIKQSKAWSVDLSNDEALAALAKLEDFFSVIIDVRDLSVLENTESPSESAVYQYDDLGVLSEPVTIDIDALLRSLRQLRDADFPGDAGAVSADAIGLRIYNGKGFVSCFNDRVMRARVSDLLISYASRYGTLRYMRYDLLNDCMQGVVFSNNQRTVNTAIAAYADSCRVTGGSAIEYDSNW